MPTCSQPKCPVATTGVCLEGHKQGCPHLLANLAEPSEAGKASRVAVILPALREPYRFHSGEKLTSAEASRMMNAMPVTMIVCAGPQSAGKTTFLARIGEMFRNGSFKSFRFAGSKTLCAFERVTWLATIVSGAGRPDTKRTYHAEKDTFFHIQIQPVEGPDRRINLLITDLPGGEVFPAILATREACDEQLALKRADHLVYFVDCESIVDSAKRHAERDMVFRFLSQVKKCRHDPANLRVSVVFSRWDKITANGTPKEHEEYCRTVIETEVRDRFESVFGPICFDRIAARPDHGASQSDAEMQAIFARWLESRPPLSLVASRSLKPKRDFCAFGLS
jgi:hypothetical protein